MNDREALEAECREQMSRAEEAAVRAGITVDPRIAAMREQEEVVVAAATAMRELQATNRTWTMEDLASAALAAIPTTCWLYVNREGHRCVQFRQGLMDLEYWTEFPLGVLAQADANREHPKE